jgi:hypothetical protein
VVSELLKIMQDEREKKDAEASMKVETFRQGRTEWAIRPAMSDYCGLRERGQRLLRPRVEEHEARL